MDDMLIVKRTFLSVFTIKSLWRLNGENTEQMYFKQLSI